MNKSYRKMIDEYGARCDVFQAGCACCEGWRIYDVTRRFVPQELLNVVIDAYQNGNLEAQEYPHLTVRKSAMALKSAVVRNARSIWQKAKEM